jgi:exo-1,4-beta-D-glucosaminidase
MKARLLARVAIALVVLAAVFVCCATEIHAETSSSNKVELAQDWKLKSATSETQPGGAISQADFQDANWYAIHRMPATVLEILQEDGVYPNLYFGKNMADTVPQDLYKQDWWYRTTFDAPAGRDTYLLEFPGINYRAEIWMNGHLLSDSQHVVGMYVAHEINATKWILKGQRNVLAVKVTPERLIQEVDGVELADSWFDWLNWKYMGYHGDLKPDSHGISFVPDRNAGIWKPVYLKVLGDVGIEHPYVRSDDVSVPESASVPERGASAKLTVYASIRNFSDRQVAGVLHGAISRAGKSPIAIEEAVTLAAGESRDVSFAPAQFPQLAVSSPDLWWPYTMGKPSLYDLRLEFVAGNDKKVSDSAQIRFGIRSITQFRDNDNQFPEVGKGGNFYIKVNGRNFLVRGGVYTPDLLFRYDEKREADILRYVKDLGLNMLRWESKISSEHIVDLADEEGIPLMFGWMQPVGNVGSVER